MLASHGSLLSLLQLGVSFEEDAQRCAVYHRSERYEQAGLRRVQHASPKTIAAMREGAERMYNATDRNLYESVTYAQRHWSRTELPAHVRAAPAMYAFSGMDLITLGTLFPDAPEYLMLADTVFKPGDLRCFDNQKCASGARWSAHTWFNHVASHRFATSSTGLMMHAFKEPHGLTPSLLLTLRLLDRKVVNASIFRRPGANFTLTYLTTAKAHGSKHKTTTTHAGNANDCVSVAYVSFSIRTSRDLDEFEAMALAPPGLGKWATLTKAGPVALWRNHSELTGRVLSNWSLAIVEDETGIHPSRIDETPGWNAHLFGDYIDFHNHRQPVQAYYNDALANHTVRKLPFNWGYGPSSKGSPKGHRGLLIAGWSGPEF